MSFTAAPLWGPLLIVYYDSAMFLEAAPEQFHQDNNAIQFPEISASTSYSPIDRLVLVLRLDVIFPATCTCLGHYFVLCFRWYIIQKLMREGERESHLEKTLNLILETLLRATNKNIAGAMFSHLFFGNARPWYNACSSKQIQKHCTLKVRRHSPAEWLNVCAFYHVYVYVYLTSS